MKGLVIIIIILLIIPSILIFSGNARIYASELNLKSVDVRNLNVPVTRNLLSTSADVINNLIHTYGMDFYEEGVILQDKLGHKHIKMLQYNHGIQVVGGEIIVHLNSKNEIHHVNGKYISHFKVPLVPSVESITALQAGLMELQDQPGLMVIKEPVLVIYGSHLAYHFIISHEGNEPGQWWFYVDAHTGQIIFRYNNIQHQGCTTPTNGYHADVIGRSLPGECSEIVEMTGWRETNGDYYIYNFNDNWGIFNEETECWSINITPDWADSDPAAISAAFNFALTQDWVMYSLGRNSFDDNGAFARGNVHTGNNYVNAYWDGTDFHFGDGDGSRVGPLTALDIVAHEYGHALTQYTSNLRYKYESGALNESYSDIMGTIVEFAYQPDGRNHYPNAMCGHSDWLCGEDAWRIDVAFRDLRNPQRYGHPSYYKGTYWYTGDGDNGGVHINSGVQNFAFYLLAEGGSGTNDGHAYDITGIGIENAAKVAMRANMVYLTSTSQYADAKAAWIHAADDLGFSTETVEAVWDAVGVDDYCDHSENFLTHEYLNSGTAQGWQDDDRSWLYTLPFDFPFYDQNFTSVWVCSNGFLDFADNFADYSNSTQELSQNVRIAPLWTDLVTIYGDIYIYQPSSDSVCFRWEAEEYGDNGQINVEVILYKDGNIKFNYGTGNTSISPSPTIGISSGDGLHYCISTYNELEDLDTPESILYTPEVVDVLHFSNQTIEAGTYIANRIIADPNVTIEGGAKIVLRATDSILLTNNFIVEEGAEVILEAESIVGKDGILIKSCARVTLEATDFLILGPHVSIETTAEVILKAGNYIRIIPDFSAALGCRLNACILDECQTMPDSSCISCTTGPSEPPETPSLFSLWIANPGSIPLITYPLGEFGMQYGGYSLPGIVSPYEGLSPWGLSPSYPTFIGFGGGFLGYSYSGYTSTSPISMAYSLGYYDGQYGGQYGRQYDKQYGGYSAPRIFSPYEGLNPWGDSPSYPAFTGFGGRFPIYTPYGFISLFGGYGLTSSEYLSF